MNDKERAFRFAMDCLIAVISLLFGFYFRGLFFGC